MRRVTGVSHGAAETFLPAQELVIGEVAHRGVRPAERVRFGEELREAGRVRLTNLLECVPAEPCGGERLARILEGREGIDGPSGLGEPADHLDPVPPQIPPRLVSVREPLPDEDWRTGAENAADLMRGSSQVRNVVTPNQSLKAEANAPVPAPMSTSVIPCDGRR